MICNVCLYEADSEEFLDGVFIKKLDIDYWAVKAAKYKIKVFGCPVCGNIQLYNPSYQKILKGQKHPLKYSKFIETHKRENSR